MQTPSQSQEYFVYLRHPYFVHHRKPKSSACYKVHKKYLIIYLWTYNESVYDVKIQISYVALESAIFKG